SGGQQQRVFLARALAQEPHILLMDEPFTGVDSTTQETILRLLDALQEEGVTTLVSTHDLKMAAERFDQTLLLNRKLIAFGTPAEVFTQEHIGKAFGDQLLKINGAVVVDQCCHGEDGEVLE
ncbi:MAG TPA: ATP-binding cassette domain-containing protein, partial [Anaerolineaceae bacterium]|nr:ATP-binding cassette domain-containing protein [Anaerolineaceae bacterium]